MDGRSHDCSFDTSVLTVASSEEPPAVDSCDKRVGGDLSFSSQQFSKGSDRSFETHQEKSQHCFDDDFSEACALHESTVADASILDSGEKVDRQSGAYSDQQSGASAQSSFVFSQVQLSRPVIIEVFCGSARVTASLKSIGLHSSFGVDHDISKAISSAKKLDLTCSGDQRIFLQWLQSPVVAGVFLAPPCGTCSQARNIKLRDPFGRPMRGPIPLRSE